MYTEKSSQEGKKGKSNVFCCKHATFDTLLKSVKYRPSDI